MEREEQVEQGEQEHSIEKDEDKGSTAYSLFVYAVRSQITTDHYLERYEFSLSYWFIF
jgi:hypothetical protein